MEPADHDATKSLEKLPECVLCLKVTRANHCCGWRKRSKRGLPLRLLLQPLRGFNNKCLGERCGFHWQRFCPPPHPTSGGQRLGGEFNYWVGQPNSLKSACLLPPAFNQEKLSSFNTSKKQKLQSDHDTLFNRRETLLTSEPSACQTVSLETSSVKHDVNQLVGETLKAPGTQHCAKNPETAAKRPSHTHTFLNPLKRS